MRKKVDTGYAPDRVHRKQNIVWVEAVLNPWLAILSLDITLFKDAIIGKNNCEGCDA